MIKFLGRRWLNYLQKKYLMRRLLDKPKRQVKFENASKFVFVQMDSIGDVIMTQPAWSALKEAVPDAKIDLICRSHVAPLFIEDPSINRIFTIETHRYRSWLPKDFRIIKAIWKEGEYDIIIDCTENPLTAGICAMPSAPFSLGLKRSSGFPYLGVPLSEAYDHSFVYPTDEHSRDVLFRLVSPWPDTRRAKKAPLLYLSDSKMQEARDYLEKRGLINAPFVVFHPGAKWPPRRWPLGHWRVLVKKLRSELGYPVLLLGGISDNQILQYIWGDSNDPSLRLLVSEDIALSAAVIKRAHLCVCHDSGAMHIAAAVGTPSVALFGPMNPQKTAPLPEEGCHPLYNPMFCSPCTQYYSRNRCRRGINFCLHAIHPDRVIEEIIPLFQDKKGAA
jgi:lipopolysaccharide heptosyltransferase II